MSLFEIEKVNIILLPNNRFCCRVTVDRFVQFYKCFYDYFLTFRSRLFIRPSQIN